MIDKSVFELFQLQFQNFANPHIQVYVGVLLLSNILGHNYSRVLSIQM